AGRDGAADGGALLPERGAVVPGGQAPRGARSRGGLVVSARRAPARREPRAAGPATPLLAVDVGNTDTVVGRFHGAELEESWRSTSGRTRADEVRLALAGMLPRGAAGSASVLCSVVPALSGPWTEALHALTGRAPLEVTARDSPIPLDVTEPDAVGPDRI